MTVRTVQRCVGGPYYSYGLLVSHLAPRSDWDYELMVYTDYELCELMVHMAPTPW